MQKILGVLVIAISIASIIFGKIHWDNKIAAYVNTEVKKTNVEEINSDQGEEKGTEIEAKRVKIMPLMKNLPDEIVSKIDNAIATGEPIHLVVMGSSTTSSDPNSWATKVKKTLIDTYGDDIFAVSIKQIRDTTSTAVLEAELHKEIVGLEPDILLFEPFILYDNGKVTIEERLENLSTILEDLKKELPELTVLLQPDHPLHKASFYPKEVEELQKYASEQNYIYLNHWEAYPDHQTDAILEYLTQNGTLNEKGHEIWARYIIDYFISKQ